MVIIMSETNQTKKSSLPAAVIASILSVVFIAVGIFWRIGISGTKLLFNDSALARFYRYYWLMLILGIASAVIAVLLIVRVRKERVKAAQTGEEAAGKTEALPPDPNEKPEEKPEPESAAPTAQTEAAPEEKSSSHCPACGCELEKGAKFCTECGHKLS